MSATGQFLLSLDIVQRLGSWSPRTTSDEQLIDWARAMAMLTGPASWKSAVCVARALVRHGRRVLDDGIELHDLPNSMSEAQVEHTIETVLTHVSDANRANESGALRKAGKAVAAIPAPVKTTTPRIAPAAPYTNSEQDSLLYTARHLPSARRRREMTLMMALMCGAGLTSKEAAKTQHRDIYTDEAGVVWVQAPGRKIPVLRRYAQALLKASAGAPGTDTMLRATHDTAVSTLNEYAKNHGMGIWKAARATNTWRVYQLTRVPLPVLAEGSRLTPRFLAGLLQYCPDISGAGFDALVLLDEESGS